MSVLPGLVTVASAVSSVLLALVALGVRRRSRLHWSFALGMLGFAAEAVAASVLLTRTELPEARILLLRTLGSVGLLLPVPWLVFLGELLGGLGVALPRWWRHALVGVGGLSVLGSATMWARPAFLVSEFPGSFLAARLEPVGRYGVMGEIVLTVGILAGLEASLRASRGTNRWRVKYLLLGLGGVFLIRFYLQSHVLLFHVVMGHYLTTGAATILLGNVVTGWALARGVLAGLEFTVSRQILYRSVVVAILGCYLFLVGALGWLLPWLGVQEELFWGSLAVFLSAVALAAVLLSENVRWRLQRFIGLHFYRSKYDYRLQWSRFTRRLGSLLTVEELAPAVVTAVTEAVGAPRAVLYLARDGDARYEVASVEGLDQPAPELTAGAPIVARLAVERAPVALGPPSDALEDEAQPAGGFPAGGVAVPLLWREALIGVLIVGPERTGAPYTVEDLEFLATVGEQAAGALATARLSEAVAQAREFEAFHRLTSFVAHDLKNSVAALSMLSQNALANFDDPEFQRDALTMLGRAVQRMKALLARLAVVRDRGVVQRESVDLVQVVREAVRPLTRDSRVHLVEDLAPVPPVSGDPEALLRVVQNLLANAVEALGDEGAVTVKTYADRGSSVVSVSDTGCGMSEGFIRTSLFAPFRSSKRGGWGIGLYQTKALVDAHGGTIEVQSKEGKGTTFWVRLPAARAGEGTDPA